MDDLPYLLALHAVEGFGPARLIKTINYFQSAKNAWNAKTSELKNLGLPDDVLQKLESHKKICYPVKYLESIQKSGIKILTVFGQNYPVVLRQIPNPPVVVYYKGDILEADKDALAVVGSRKVSSYGKMVTEQFVSQLAGGFTIVSGLARGVDAIAHKTAIEAGGRTIAILGGGLNRLFPAENAALSHTISQNGAVVSEFPPNYPPYPGNFPLRNRIIAALSLGVLVTEAGVDSGSMITANYAAEYGREVFAVPGPVTSYLSIGPAQLIQKGAHLVTGPSEILDILGRKPIGLPKNDIPLSDFETRLMDCLSHGSKHIDEVCRELRKPLAQVSAALVKMEIHGIVTNLGGGVFAKV